jgi:hypothetical protein
LTGRRADVELVPCSNGWKSTPRYSRLDDLTAEQRAAVFQLGHDDLLQRAKVPFVGVRDHLPRISRRPHRAPNERIDVKELGDSAEEEQKL